MAAYLRFYDPLELIESVRNYIFAHPKCTIVGTTDSLRQMYDPLRQMCDFYVEPELVDPYEISAGWTIRSMDVVDCPNTNLRKLFLSSEGRNTLIRKIREEDFGRKRTRYDLLASDYDLV